MYAWDRSRQQAGIESAMAAQARCDRHWRELEIKCAAAALSGAWPQEADIPLGYDERDAKV